MKNILKSLFIVFSLIFVTACGGGGESSSGEITTPTPTPAPTPAPEPTPQLIGEIYGDQDNGMFGLRSELNFDGTRLVIGARNHFNEAGAAYIYEFSQNQWSIMTDPIRGGSGNYHFGSHLAMSNDGNIIWVSTCSIFKQCSNRGTKRLIYNNGQWTESIQSTGIVIRINRDSTLQATAVPPSEGLKINDVPKNGNFGTGFKYKLSELCPPESTGSNCWDMQQLRSFEISNDEDGVTLIAAIPNQDFTFDPSRGRGFVLIWEWTWDEINESVELTGKWPSKEADFIEGRNDGDLNGISIALNGNGDVMAIASSRYDGNNENSGKVRVFEKTLNGWVQLGQDLLGEGDEYDQFGQSIDLDDSGTTIAIGAVNPNGPGYTYVYRLSENGNWVQAMPKIPFFKVEMADEINPFYYIYNNKSISLSGDGTKLAVSNINENTNSVQNAGVVRIYKVE